MQYPDPATMTQIVMKLQDVLQDCHEKGHSPQALVWSMLGFIVMQCKAQPNPEGAMAEALKIFKVMETILFEMMHGDLLYPKVYSSDGKEEIKI